MDDSDVDVLIVGAGPTGLMLAGELALGGINPVLVDRRVEPTRESRALGFSARTIEEFDQRGLIEEFGGVSTIPVGHFGGIELDYRILPGGSYGARGIPQSRTEAVLGGRAAAHGVTVRRGWRVTGLEQDADGVTTTLDTPEGPRRLRTGWVVGCDGARSTVREAAGIEFPGTEPVIEMWLADVAGPRLRPRFSGERVAGGMVMVLPMGPELNRVVVHERAVPVPGRRESLEFGEVAAAWQRLTGEDISGGRPLWVSWFTDSSRLAQRYRVGRVLLAGDAAHTHLPIGGQGMSAGVQDAVNLGWKLAAHARGDAPPGLLDTYHTERHVVGAGVITNTLAQRLLYLSDERVDPLREVFAELMREPGVRRRLAGMVTGLDIHYDVGPGEHPLLGRRVPDGELVAADGARSTVFTHLHAGRAVLLRLAEDPGPRDPDATGLPTRVDVVTARVHGQGGRGPFAGLTALLIRPDGYVAWVEPSAIPLSEALARWFGRATVAA